MSFLITKDFLYMSRMSVRMVLLFWGGFFAADLVTNGFFSLMSDSTKLVFNKGFCGALALDCAREIFRVGRILLLGSKTFTSLSELSLETDLSL